MISLRRKNINKSLNGETAEKRRFGTSFLILTDWLNLLCLLITLGVAVWSVDQAGWIRPSTSLIAILVLAAATGFILSKSNLPAIGSHPLALFIGLIVIFWQGLLLFPDSSLAFRVLHMVSDIRVWWHAQVIGAPSPVTIHVALIFGYLTWIIGYFSAWTVIKQKNPWIAVLLGIIVVLVNLNFWVRERYYYFLIYIIAALILVVVVKYSKYYSQLKKNSYHQAAPVPLFWAATSLCLIIVAVSITWNNPGFRISKIADYARANDPFKGSVQTYWKSFFAPVPGSGVPTLNHGVQQELFFGGSLQLNDQVNFIINTDQKSYWKTQIYDVYNSTGWRTGEIESKVIDQATSSTDLPVPDKREGELSYTIISQVYTHVLPTTGEFISGNIPVLEKILTPQIFEIRITDSSADSLLPPDLASAAKVLRTYISSRRRTDQQIATSIPAGLKLLNISRSANTILSIYVSRDQPEDKSVVSLSSIPVLTQQQKATITVQPPPDATPAELVAAGDNYPARITDRYLQLPPSLPLRVRALAATTTEGLKNPYQKAQAIKDQLAKYQYSLILDPPPADTDGVDYFLFTQKTGYCNYFASAATVMLRSIGIPARMVVGFLPGQYDADSHRYIIRDRDYHAWTEIYFPQYGWVQFDATPVGNTSAGIAGSADVSPEYLDYLYFLNQNSEEGTAEQVSSAATSKGNNTGLVIFTLCYTFMILLLIGLIRLLERPRNTSAMYSRMVLLASLAGIGPKPRQTALEFSRQLSVALPQHTPVINGIVQTYLVNRYSRAPSAIPMNQKFKKTWPKLRWTLILRVLRIK